MQLPIYQIDAFAEGPFSGNPAAVCALNHWPEDGLLQDIAAENNLSETAFFVPDGPRWKLRWFTPGAEVRLCGHATMATAYVLFEHLGVPGDRLCFDTLSGELVARRSEQGLAIDLPAWSLEPCESSPWSGLVDVPLREAWKAGEDLLLRVDSQGELLRLRPRLGAMRDAGCRGVIVTAAGEDCDFVSRFFAPAVGVDEDPVTGSAHCALTPYWSERLGRDNLSARQLSRRGGALQCQLDGDRVILAGRCRPYLHGFISVA